MGDRSTITDRDRTRRLRAILIVACWVVAVGCVVGSTRLLAPVRALGIEGLGATVPLDEVADRVHALVLVSVATVVLLRGTATRYGWLMMLAGGSLSALVLAEEYALYSVYGPGSGVLAEVAIVGQETWMVFFASIVLLLPALFPDGYPVVRWRRPVRFATWAWAALLAVYLLADRPAGNALLDLPGAPQNPVGVLPVPIDVINVWWAVLTLVSLVLSGASVVSRWRSSSRDVRQQMSWVLIAFGVAVASVLALLLDTLLVEVVGVDTGLGALSTIVPSASGVLVAVALGLGVLRYRLYDVDLVANRTLVYATMTFGVVGAYALVVTGVVALLPDLGDSRAAVLATALVAVGFAPARARVQRAVNRITFGRRDDPYAVVSELGAVLARSADPGATLQTVVETVAATLKLPGAAVELDLDGRWQTPATTGRLGREAETVELIHHGDVVGRMLAARRSPNEPLHDDDHRLLRTIAAHAAAVAHALRLHLALQRSREELVLAREEERRRLRRDLHDGLGPALASQTFRIDAVLAQLGPGDAEATELLRDLKAQNRELVADIRRLVYELRPPALDELGLVGALAAYAGQLAATRDVHVQVTPDPDPLSALPAAVEVAAYRIATEAITNVLRHAQATSCSVALHRHDGGLTVTVADDGVGVRAVTQAGVGMTSMQERARELGGTVAISRLASGGTQVTATLPVTQQVGPVLAPGDRDDPDALTRSVDHVGAARG